LFTCLVGFALLAQLVPWLVGSDSRMLTVDLACVYAIGAIGLNVIFGMGGLISIAQAAVMAIGGYTLILLFGDEMGIVPALLAAAGAAAAVSLLTAVVGARIKTHYFILVSLALAQIILLIATKATGLTGGSNGTAIKDVPAIAGLDLTLPGEFFRFAVVVVVIVWYLADTLRASRIGLGLSALTMNEHVAMAAGVAPQRYRLLAAGVGGAFGGLAGGMLALLIGYLGPQTFGLQTAILLLLIVVVAGQARNGSVVLAALILTILTQGLLTYRAVGQLVYGIGLILLIVFAPEGLSGAAQAVRKLLRRTALRERAAR
jgi:ABC-type branched-subunit amino acid transport system permease subunit